jgi:hypothetical protein
VPQRSRQLNCRGSHGKNSLPCDFSEHDQGDGHQRKIRLTGYTTVSSGGYTSVYPEHDP